MTFLLVVLATLALWEFATDYLPSVPSYLQYPLVVAAGVGLSFLPAGPILSGLGAAGGVLLLHVWIKSKQEQPVLSTRLR